MTTRYSGMYCSVHRFGLGFIDWFCSESSAVSAGTFGTEYIRFTPPAQWQAEEGHEANNHDSSHKDLDSDLDHDSEAHNTPSLDLGLNTIRSSISPDSEAAESGATQLTAIGNIPLVSPLFSFYCSITDDGEDTRFSSLQAEVHQGFQEVFNRIERRALDQARDARLDKLEIKNVINAEIHAVRTEIQEVRAEIQEVKHQIDANKSILGRIKDILQSFVSI